MRLHASKLFCAVALIALAFPVWAHTDSIPLHSDGTTVVGQTQLKTGDYELKVKDNATQIEITQNGKVVAEAPVKWIQLQKKPTNTEVVMDKDRVVEVDFGGKTQAVQVTGSVDQTTGN